MNYLSELPDLLLIVLQAILAYVVGYAKNHPVVTGLAVLALLRLFGITVQTGHKGVLFVCGRVRKELEPGFHFLLPFVLTARTIPVRSITLDLPRQRITTADGLVYDVQANIVYRVADPKLALTQIDNLRHGIEVMLALIVEGLLAGQTRAAVLDFKALDAELSARAEAALGRWGVTVEQAGFKSIAPTHKTLRLTQLAALGDERKRVLQELIAQGVRVNAALALLGAEHRLVGHARARYHALHRPARLAPAAAEAPRAPTLLPGEEPPVAQKPPQAEEASTPETQGAEFVLPAEGTFPQAPPRPKKTTKGVQPRSWLRLRGRLRGTRRHQGCRA
jgi:regulator of protease activity HflC (stomatin/prohibitin superfamily)